MQKKWQIGIHIQVDKLFAVALAPTHTQWQLKKLWALSEDMSKPELIIKLLRSIRRTIPHHHSVRTLLPDSSVLQQKIDLPKVQLSELELASFVEACVTKQFPFAIHELAVDYRRLEDDKNQIMITAARKSEIDHWCNLFHRANLNLDVIDIESSITHFMFKTSQLLAKEFASPCHLNQLNIIDPDNLLPQSLSDLYLPFGLALRWSDY